MVFEVVWDSAVLKILDKLPRQEAERIVKKIGLVRENPLRYVERLVEMDGYKVRVGDYRVFVDLEHLQNKLIVRTIRHRRDAYKKK